MSFVDPRLGRGRSIVWSAGSSMVEISPLTAGPNCDGMSTLMIGPLLKLKKFRRQVVSRGSACAFGCPRVIRLMHLWACIGACIPETTMRVGGVSSETSTTTSRHFACRSGWSQTSVMSVALSHAGYGSKGTARMSGACPALLLYKFLAAAATFSSWPLSAGAHVSRVWSPCCVRARSISSGGPQR